MHAIQVSTSREIRTMTDSCGLRTLFEPRKARGKRRKYGVKYDHEFDELAAVVNQEAEQLTVLPTALLDRVDIQTPLMVVDEDGCYRARPAMDLVSRSLMGIA